MAVDSPVLRLFVAVHPSTEAVDDLAAVVGRLRVSLANAPGHSTRLTSQHQWHITVAFLGDVPADRLRRAVQMLQAVAAQIRCLRLCLAGGGTFGGARDPILWAGLAGDVTELRLLGAAVRRALRRARLPFDDRPWRAHLTLSRPGSRVSAQDVAADVATLAAYRGPQWTVSELVLLHSELRQTPTGPAPHYTTVATAPLRQP